MVIHRVNLADVELHTITDLGQTLLAVVEAIQNPHGVATVQQLASQDRSDVAGTADD